MGLMMTGAPEEEMTTEEEGEAWMMDHAVVVMTPSPGNPLGDLVSRLASVTNNVTTNKVSQYFDTDSILNWIFTLGGHQHCNNETLLDMFKNLYV